LDVSTNQKSRWDLGKIKFGLQINFNASAPDGT
jgi:hypothetical protein